MKLFFSFRIPGAGLSLACLLPALAWSQPMILNDGALNTFTQQFRDEDRWYFNVSTDDQVSQVNNGTYGGQWVKNAAAFDYLKTRIPLLDIPDDEFEKTYYYRWWTYRKHIKNIGTSGTPKFVVTEYIDPVSWADTSNAISAPVGNQLYEGRWLNDPKVTEDYIRYWMTDPAANPRRYSAWLADATLARNLVIPNDAMITEMVTSSSNRLNLQSNWDGWVLNDSRPGGQTQQAHFDTGDGLFWQNDDRDAMEVSYSGNGKRPSINSYLYGDAKAIAEMFRIAARQEPAQAAGRLASAAQFDLLAANLQIAVQNQLWDPRDEFFKTGYGPASTGAPASSADTTILRHTWWAPNHLGTTEWVQYDFAAPVTLSRTEVYFYDDRPSGGTRVPASWELQYWNGTAWVSCVRKAGQTYGVDRNVYNGVDIEAVTTTKIRLVAVLQPGYSAGELEWRMLSPQGVNLAVMATPSASYTDIYGGTVSALNDEGRYPVQDRRELIGFTPWYFGLPAQNGAVNFDVAWSHLASFLAGPGLTTGAMDEAGYATGQLGACCQWNGPVWPFATTVTLKAMERLLHEHTQGYVTPSDYFACLKAYAYSHRFALSRGTDQRTLCWIDESMTSGGAQSGVWTHVGGDGLHPGSAPRGMAYNHSGFADLVITGLMGLQPRADDLVEIAPLVPRGSDGKFVWNHFCLDQVAYHGSLLTIVYDEDGQHYGAGTGFSVFADGIRIAHSDTCGPLHGKLPDAIERWGASFFSGHPDVTDLRATADPDGDGSPNLAEYVFGSNPSKVDSKPATRVWTAPLAGQDPAQRYLFMEATVSESNTVVSLQPQVSTDLITWKTGGDVFEEMASEPQGDGTRLRRFRSKTACIPGQPEFVRWLMSY